MDIDTQIKLGHLLLHERKCRVCGELRNLIEGYYKTRKGSNPSSYSYECKICTIRRIVESRKNKNPFVDWSYPDW